MSCAIELTVSLKIPDVAAITARRALQNAMGYGDVLADLNRADWWRITVNTDDLAAALALGKELADDTNIFVNPNKHVYRLAEHAGVREPKPGLTPVGMLTGFKDDAKAALNLQALQGRLGYGDRVVGLELGTLWTFWLKEPDVDKAKALAEKMTVSSDRHSGLLVNPNSQWWGLL